jgi:hypothetical protein
MMVVEETKVIKIDGQAFSVDDLPDDVRSLVTFYDDWRQRELEARSTLLQVQTSLRAMKNEIAVAIQRIEEENDEETPENSE